jgi:O-antigen/teichoic acid export membrane protein
MIKKTISYLLYSIISAIIGFATMAFMARTIDQESIGVIGLFMGILFVSPELISFSTSGLVSINRSSLYVKDYKSYTNKHITFAIVNFLFVSIVSILVYLYLQVYFLFFIALPILSFIIFLMNFHQSELIQDGNVRASGLYNLLNSVILGGLTFITLNFTSLTWNGRIFCLVISNFIVLLFMYNRTFTSLKYFKFKLDRIEFKEYLKYGSPLFLGLGAGWVLNQADNYIILHFFNLKAVGMYAIAYSIGNIVNLINQASTNSIVPVLYNALAIKNGHLIIRKINLQYSAIILTISLVIGISSYWYMPIIFGSQYSSSYQIVLVISLAFAFNGIYRTTGGVIAYYKKSQLQMKLLVICAMTNVIISISLIPFCGILSPAIGTLFAYILLAILSYHYSWKILHLKEEIA